MARRLTILLIIILAVTTVIPPNTNSSTTSSSSHFNNGVFLADPSGTITAFNITQTVMDTYTNTANVTTASSSGSNGTLALIGTTSFNFTVRANTHDTGSQNITWTVAVPSLSGACTGCNKVFVRFSFFGKVDSGGNATFAIYRNGGGRVTGAGSSENNTANIPQRFVSVDSGCNDPSEVCFDATQQAGQKLLVAFRFGWNFAGNASSTKVLSVEVGNMIVYAGPGFTNAASHDMALSGPTAVTHNATFRKLDYNRTRTINANITGDWSKLIVTFYYPSGYNATSVQVFNGTTSVATLAPTGYCKAADCKGFNTTLTSLDLTSAGLVVGGYKFSVIAGTLNSIRSIKTVIGNVTQQNWQPSESVPVRLNNTAAVKRAGTVTFILKHSGGQVSNYAPFTNVQSGGLFNITAPAKPLGSWNVTASFDSPYDFGSNSTFIFTQHLILQPGGFSYSGGNSELYANGTVQLESTTTTPSADASVAIFGVSTLTSGPYIKTYPAQSTGLYMNNTTFVNGAFTQGQTLIMYVTIVNPANVTTVGNVTITHEFLPGQEHGINATFTPSNLDGNLALGAKIYRVDISFTSGRMDVRAGSLRTGTTVTVSSKVGNSPVFDTRQHFGLFKITVSSRPSSGGSTTVNTVETQPYAYVFTSTLISSGGGRVLASAFARTDTNGRFTATLNSTRILESRRLALVVLARDDNGIVLGNQDPTGAIDTLVLCGPSTGSSCQPVLDGPREATPNQQVTMTLRLRNNSTRLSMNLNVTMNLSRESSILTTQTKPLNLQPGASTDVQFSFTAPGSLGDYSLSFTSVQYGAPISTSTLKVMLIPTWLQVAIPVLIGLGVAAAFLIYSWRRKPAPATTKATEKTRPARPRPQPGSGPRNP